MHSYGANLQLYGFHSFEEPRFGWGIENIPDAVSIQPVAHHPFASHPFPAKSCPLTLCRLV